ncbi:hypothetical protein D3C81_1244160 [compost metagenome]
MTPTPPATQARIVSSAPNSIGVARTIPLSENHPSSRCRYEHPRRNTIAFRSGVDWMASIVGIVSGVTRTSSSRKTAWLCRSGWLSGPPTNAASSRHSTTSLVRLALVPVVNDRLTFG